MLVTTGTFIVREWYRPMDRTWPDEEGEQVLYGPFATLDDAVEFMNREPVEQALYESRVEYMNTPTRGEDGSWNY